MACEWPSGVGGDVVVPCACHYGEVGQVCKGGMHTVQLILPGVPLWHLLISGQVRDK